MSALPQEKPLPCQAFDDDPQVLAEVLREGVNLAVWTRRLSPALRDFAAALVRNRPGLALSQTLEMEEERLPVLDVYKRQEMDDREEETYAFLGAAVKALR